MRMEDWVLETSYTIRTNFVLQRWDTPPETDGLGIQDTILNTLRDRPETSRLEAVVWGGGATCLDYWCPGSCSRLCWSCQHILGCCSSMPALKLVPLSSIAGWCWKQISKVVHTTALEVYTLELIVLALSLIFGNGRQPTTVPQS